MKKCNACGKEFEDGVFCPDCGEKLEEVVSNTTNDSVNFCPNCGEKMDASSEFCTNCGWSKNGIKNATSSKIGFKLPSFDMKKLIIVPVVLVVVLILFLVKNLFFGGLGKGQDAIVNGMNNSIISITKNEIVDIVSNTFSHGSIETQMSAVPEIDGLYIPVDGSANVKLNFDNNKFAISFDGKINGTSFKDNVIYIDKEKVVAKVPVAFGEKKVYGINLNNFEDSWLMNNLPYYMSSAIRNAIKNSDQINQDVLKKDLKDIYIAGIKVLKKSIKENLKFINENDEVSFGDKDVKVLKVSSELTYANINKIASDMLKWMKTSKEFKKFVKDNYKIINLYYNSYSDANADETYELFVGNVDRLLNGMDNFIDGNFGRVDFYISKNTKQIVKFIFKDANYSYNDCSFTIGPNWKKPEKVSLKVGSDDVGYTMAEDGGDCVCKLSYNNNAIAIMNWNKKSGEFTAKDPNGNYKISGKLKFGDKTNIEIYSINAPYFNINPNTTIIVKKKDSLPSVPNKYEDILDMSMGEVEDLGREIIERIGEKFEISGLLQSLY